MTTRTSPERLRDAVATQLLTYLGEGGVSEAAVFSAVDPSRLSVENLERLLRVRFVLSSGVTEFAHRVPDELRRVRRSTRRTTQTERGSVSGRVDWPQTHACRPRAGHDDSTLYATTTQSVEYDTPENRVVKQLLAVIVDVIREEFLADDHDWQSEWSGASVEELTRVYRDNPYLSRLPSPGSYSVTTRDVDAARRSRRPFYRDAAALWRLYNDLLDGRYDRTDVQELLRETVIAPSEPPRLFELYAVFRLLDSLDNSALQYRTVAPGTGAVASLETPQTLVDVYCDATGPVTLSEPLPSTPPESVREPFSRTLAAARAYDSHREAILGTGSRAGYYDGRPDFVVCVFDRLDGNRSLRAVTLGEVKYTRREATLARGLRELSEYLSFVRHDGEYLAESDVLLRGVLVTNDGGQFDRHENVVHVGLSPSAGELREAVSGFL